MIDIAILRENPTLVKENMKKKFQDDKIGLVDEAYKLDKDYREVLTKAREMMLDGGAYSIEHVDMTGEVAESLGMVCGGTMEVLIEIDKSI